MLHLYIYQHYCKTKKYIVYMQINYQFNLYAYIDFFGKIFLTVVPLYWKILYFGQHGSRFINLTVVQL